MAQTLMESDRIGAITWAKAALATFERIGLRMTHIGRLVCCASLVNLSERRRATRSYLARVSLKCWKYLPKAIQTGLLLSVW